jgi:transaldolase
MSDPQSVATVAADSSDPGAAPLALMTRQTPTQFFNDSCNATELRYAIERGATGATSNPVICLTVLKQEWARWKPVLDDLARANPRWSETDVAWALYRKIGESAAELLRPVFESHNRQWGRLSMQTNPTLYNNTEAMLEQSIELSKLAPNMQVKMPCTSFGVAMIEEATYLGVSLNVTVSFSVPQVLEIAEAIERGLTRRKVAGADTSHMSPVATMMVGRLDDWLKVVAQREGLPADEHLDWAGLACAKRAYSLFQERNYTTKFLVAAYRHLGHWSQLVGGDLVHTMPYEWQVRANQSGLHPTSTIHDPVPAQHLAKLLEMPEFRRAFEPDGMTVDEFDSFGPTVRTLRSFIGAWHDFVGVARDAMLPDPD